MRFLTRPVRWSCRYESVAKTLIRLIQAVRGAMLFLGCIALVGGCSNTEISQEIAELNDRGVAEMERFEYATAYETFVEVVELRPDWIHGRVNLAIATLNRQNPNDEYLAMEMLDEILTQEPVNLRALYTSAIIQFYVGQVDTARERFAQVTELDSKDAYAIYFLGQLDVQDQDYERAIDYLDRAIELDPYIKSAYWAGYLASLRLGNTDEADAYLQIYQLYENNPIAKTVDISYKKMGPKAEATTVLFVPEQVPALRADLDIFDVREELVSDFSTGSLSVADVNGDGRYDLISFSTDSVDVRYRTGSDFGEPTELALPTSDDQFPLWGDINDDGFLDVMLCGSDGLILHGGKQANDWSQSQKLSAEPCIAALLVDADHDGDLDVFFATAQQTKLLNNNRDGTFLDISERLDLANHGNVRQILVEDFDSDRDLDVFLIYEDAENVLLENDRTWNYRKLDEPKLLQELDLVAATAADTDANGFPEVIGVLRDGSFLTSTYDGVGWVEQSYPAIELENQKHIPFEIGAFEFDGDSNLELLTVAADGIVTLHAEDFAVLDSIPASDVKTALPVYLQPNSPPGLAGICCGGLHLWRPDTHSNRFLALTLSGSNESEKQRSNASGLGAKVQTRVTGQWNIQRLLDQHSGPAQSLMPLSIGLGEEDQAGFVLIEWSNGVTQSEIGLAASSLHHIVETNREIASCPIVFAWNGSRYEFVSDVLGVAALGLFATPDELVPVRNFENILLTADQLVAKDGKYKVKLGEPMEEVLYLDATELTVLDVEQGSGIALDERYATSEPNATGRLIGYQQLRIPESAVDGEGVDIHAQISRRDGVPVPIGERDQRFIGRLKNEQTITLYFDEPLPQDDQVLIADGWMQYPYSQTTFGAWQANAPYEPPTLSARDADGNWSEIAEHFGFPAGTARQMTLPLPRLPVGTDALAISFGMEIHFDRIAVATESSQQPRTQTILPDSAYIRRVGFAKRTVDQYDRPHYDYANRSAYWDAKIAEGFYTRFGDVLPLVSNQDGGVAIVGAGEEIHIEFPSVEPPPEGFDRYYVIRFEGWARDMDLYTRHGETVAPLPVLEQADAQSLTQGQRLNNEYNVRFRGE